MRARLSPVLTVENDEIVLSEGGVPQHRWAISDIVEIAAYKRDEVVTDLICFELRMADGSFWTLHEEIAGFDDVVAALERLPGFFVGWREKLVLPPFDRNWMVVWGEARLIAGAVMAGSGA